MVNRFFYPSLLKKGEVICLENKELHHLHVMRLNIHDSIEIVNGKHVLAHGVIEVITKDFAKIMLKSVEKKAAASPPIVLIQAFPKLAHLELIVEKGTELGAQSFWIFPGELSEKKEISENQIDRLRSISISALKQCGRLDLPSLEIHPSLSRFTFPSENIFFGDLEAKDSICSSFIHWEKPIYFFVGPEKGWSENEHQILMQHAKPIHLHSHVLRTETAAMFSIGLTCYLRDLQALQN